MFTKPVNDPSVSTSSLVKRVIMSTLLLTDMMTNALRGLTKYKVYKHKVYKHCHRQNVTSHHSFSPLWLF